MKNQKEKNKKKENQQKNHEKIEGGTREGFEYGDMKNKRKRRRNCRAIVGDDKNRKKIR